MRPHIIALGLVLIWLTGCAAKVETPSVVHAPRTVQLLDHGRHTSLVLTTFDQTRIRYAYNTWEFFAEDAGGVLPSTRAALTSNPAALGRQVLSPERQGEDRDALEELVGVDIERIYTFDVSGARVDALLRSLEGQFHSSQEEPHFSKKRALSFIHHPWPATFGYNSNHMVADWLYRLDVEVHGNPALGRWRFDTAGGPH